MKRICFLVDSIFSIGGVQRVTAVIAKELAKDYDVTIVTFDKKEQEDTFLYNLNEANINYRFLSYPAVNKFKKKICRICSGIYLRLQPQSKWSSNLYARSSFPSELRNALVKELKQGDYDVVFGVHAPLAARIATVRKLYRTIVLSHHDAELYSKYDPFFFPTVIYNPLTLVPGRPSNGTTKRFLAIGRFSHYHKGFDVLIKAFNLFTKNDKEWILDIVGEGPEKDLYCKLIQQYNLEERIKIHPFTHDVQSYYSNGQIYVLSSRWEGFGLVLVEAMAHGLPVISSDIPTSKEILGDFGMYFKNGDAHDLGCKLQEATLLNWKEKSQQAKEIALRFDIKHIIEQWKQLIEL